MKIRCSAANDSFDHDNDTFNGIHPMILAAKANSEDLPNWKQATTKVDAEGFWEELD